MKMRRIFGLDDFPVGIGNVPAYSGINYGSGGTPNGIPLSLLNDQKWMTGSSTSNAFLPLVTGIGMDNVGKTVFGYRVMCSSPANIHCNSLYNAAGSAGLTNNTLAAAGVAASVIAYVETVLDWVNYTVSSYVNGNTTPAISVQLTQAQMASILTTYPAITLGGRGAAGVTWYIRDMHFREYDIGETYVPLKSPRIAPILVTNVDQADWVTSNSGAAVDVLNTPFADLSASLTAPTLDSQVIGTPRPIQMDLVLKDRFQGTILGIDLVDTMKSSESVIVPQQHQITQNGQTIVGVSFTPTAAMQYRKSLFANLALAPDGTTWTRSKINATRLKLGYGT